MARRRKGRPVHGWVIVDKPHGLTSTQVVGQVRRVFDAQFRDVVGEKRDERGHPDRGREMGCVHRDEVFSSRTHRQDVSWNRSPPFA